MTSRERVIAVIDHRKPDRIPIYGWVGANLGEPITEAFGSVGAFEDKYEFDYAHLWGGPPCYDGKALEAATEACGGTMTPKALLDVPLLDPNDSAGYESMREQIRYHKEKRGRFVYIQTPGLFEHHNGNFGIENHLAYLALYEDDLQAVYRRQAEWTRAFAHNCLDVGVDMIHVSDDWGSQNGLMFSPALWRRLLYPHHKTVCDAVRGRGGFLSLHTDGNNLAVVDGVVELGFHVMHPWQESAGMPLALFRDRYRNVLTAMGGLDVQTTIGFGKRDFLRAEIERVIEMFRDGGLLFCTSHFVQKHCTIEELTFAYDLAYDLVRKGAGA